MEPNFLDRVLFRPDNKRVRGVVPVGTRNEKKKPISPKPIHSNAQDDNQTALAVTSDGAANKSLNNLPGTKVSHCCEGEKGASGRAETRR